MIHKLPAAGWMMVSAVVAPPSGARRRDKLFRMLVQNSIVFLYSHTCATTEHSPQTSFPNSMHLLNQIRCIIIARIDFVCTTNTYDCTLRIGNRRPKTIMMHHYPRFGTTCFSYSLWSKYSLECPLADSRPVRDPVFRPGGILFRLYRINQKLTVCNVGVVASPVRGYTPITVCETGPAAKTVGKEKKNR